MQLPPNDANQQGQPQPFYNQPTEAFQQPQPPIAPPVPSRPTGFMAWLDRPSRSRTILLGCLVPIFVALCCITASVSAFNAMKGQTTLTSPQPSPTIAIDTTAVFVATTTATATPQPTLAPTKPKPTPTLKPTPKPTTLPPTPTPRPQPTPTPCADPCNPWGYNFSPGNLIYNPNANFCAYFNCISNFWNGRGFVNECQDGSYSKSGGIRGDCSYHGGELRPLYSH